MAPDRNRLRRQYLKIRTLAFALGAACAVLFVPMCICTVLLAIYGVVAMLFMAQPIGLMLLVLTLIPASLAFGLWKGLHVARVKASVAYVPPVLPAAYPAEEILVRASMEPPVAQSELLLRAAQGQETRQEELLRISGE